MRSCFGRLVLTNAGIKHMWLRTVSRRRKLELSNKITAMIGQGKISSFFTSSSSKRQSGREPNQDQDTPQKKSKMEEEPPCQLSPEQCRQIAENKRAALAKLQRVVSGSGSLECTLLADIGRSWRSALEPEFTKPYFVQLSKFVKSERQKCTVYPPARQVFAWTKICDITDVKVVILGQDPYHDVGQAHGLCFSVPSGVRPPPSLVNMYKELTTDIDGFNHPGHGNLTGWAKQGVLLLNACLTVRAHQANSHKDHGWETFTDAVITWLNDNSSGLVFMLWGAYAQKKGARINTKKHHILKGVHPSPLSAHRGFFGCKHFSKANALLETEGRRAIDWKSLPA